MRADTHTHTHTHARAEHVRALTIWGGHTRTGHTVLFGGYQLDQSRAHRVIALAGLSKG
jgi:hypothetical protein